MSAKVSLNIKNKVNLITDFSFEIVLFCIILIFSIIKFNSSKVYAGCDPSASQRERFNQIAQLHLDIKKSGKGGDLTRREVNLHSGKTVTGYVTEVRNQRRHQVVVMQLDDGQLHTFSITAVKEFKSTSPSVGETVDLASKRPTRSGESRTLETADTSRPASRGPTSSEQSSITLPSSGVTIDLKADIQVINVRSATHVEEVRDVKVISVRRDFGDGETWIELKSTKNGDTFFVNEKHIESINKDRALPVYNTPEQIEGFYQSVLRSEKSRPDYYYDGLNFGEVKVDGNVYSGFISNKDGKLTVVTTSPYKTHVIENLNDIESIKLTQERFAIRKPENWLRIQQQLETSPTDVGAFQVTVQWKNGRSITGKIVSKSRDSNKITILLDNGGIQKIDVSDVENLIINQSPIPSQGRKDLLAHYRKHPLDGIIEDTGIVKFTIDNTEFEGQIVKFGQNEIKVRLSGGSEVEYKFQDMNSFEVLELPELINENAQISLRDAIVDGRQGQWKERVSIGELNELEDQVKAYASSDELKSRGISLTSPDRDIWTSLDSHIYGTLRDNKKIRVQRVASSGEEVSIAPEVLNDKLHIYQFKISDKTKFESMAKEDFDPFYGHWTDDPNVPAMFKNLEADGFSVVIDPSIKLQDTPVGGAVGAYQNSGKKIIALRENSPPTDFIHEYAHWEFDKNVVREIGGDKSSIPAYQEKLRSNSDFYQSEINKYLEKIPRELLKKYGGKKKFIEGLLSYEIDPKIFLKDHPNFNPEMIKFIERSKHLDLDIDALDEWNSFDAEVLGMKNRYEIHGKDETFVHSLRDYTLRYCEEHLKELKSSGESSDIIVDTELEVRKQRHDADVAIGKQVNDSDMKIVTEYFNHYGIKSVFRKPPRGVAKAARDVGRNVAGAAKEGAKITGVAVTTAGAMIGTGLWLADKYELISIFPPKESSDSSESKRDPVISVRDKSGKIKMVPLGDLKKELDAQGSE